MMTPGREPDLDAKHARAERQLALVRAAIIAFNSGAFLLSDKSAGVPALGYAIVVVALSYSAFSLLRVPRQGGTARPPSYFTTVTDSVLIAGWILATGGGDSPFFPLWCVSLGAIALRFDFRTTVAAGGAYLAMHVLVLAVSGDLGRDPTRDVVQGAYIVFASLVAGLTARLWLDEADARARATANVADARAAEAKFRALLEFSPDPVVVLDGRGEVLLMNAAAETVFRTRRQEWTGRRADELIERRARPAFVAWRTDALGRPAVGPSTAAFRGERAEGTFPLEVVARATDAEDGRRLICVMRDISERVAAEEARLANAERLKEIERLKEMDRFRTRFINSAAHELGTPLTPIKMQVSILEMSDPATLEPRQRRAVEILRRNVDRLTSLVQDVLDVARAQVDRLGVERRPLDLHRVVREAVESFEEPARREGVTLTSRIAPDLHLHGDEKRLTQVLFNLLSNATKFTPAGGTITVAAAREGDDVVIAVRDSGVGIDPTQTHRLFQPFSQIQDPRDRARGGTGLGLHISKTIVELHDGRIDVHSQGRGHGSTFTVRLPLRPPRERAAAPAPAPAPAATPAAVVPPLPRRSPLQRRIEELI